MKPPKFIFSDSDIVMMYAFFHTGSIYESHDKNGISHCLEHMLFKSTKDYDSDQILKNLTFIGGNYNAITSRDITYYYIHTHSSGWKTSLKLLLSMLYSPRLLEKEWESEKSVVKEEITNDMDDNDIIMKSLLSSRNPYTYSIGGTKRTVNKITAIDMKRYYEEFYMNSNRVTFVISCPRKLHSDILKFYQDHKPNIPTIPINIPQYIDEFSPKLMFKFKSGDTNTNILSFNAFKIQDWKRLNILNLLNYILAESSLYSLLMYELREKRGLIYSIKCRVETYEHLSVNTIQFSTSQTDNLVYILKLLMRIINKIKYVGLEDKTFRFYKESYLNTLQYMLSKKDYVFMIKALNYHYDVPDFSIAELIEHIRSIKNNDIKEVCREIYDFAKMGMVIMGDPRKIKSRDIEKLYGKIVM